jgi:hypothetical protein
MLLRAYLPKFITALFGGLFIATGILTFGTSEIFDRLFIAVLIFTAFVCRSNINVVSVVVILIIQLVWEELAWLYQQDNYVVKSILYSSSLWIVYYFRHDWVIKIILPSVVLVSAAEIYWVLSDYQAPKIYWNIWIMISNLFVRNLLFSRVSFVDQYFAGRGQSINLDWIIYKLSAFTIVIQALVILEYLVRHIFGVSNLLLFYYAYPYLIQGIGTISIWATFDESFKHLVSRTLKA